MLYVAVAVILAYAAFSTADWRPMDAARWAWLPGTLLGVIGGTFGSLSGVLAAKGRARSAVLLSGALLLAASVGMLLGGVLLLAMRRTWYLWYMWLLPGGLGCLLFPRVLHTIARAYNQAEMRRLQAKDISTP